MNELDDGKITRGNGDAKMRAKQTNKPASEYEAATRLTFTFEGESELKRVSFTWLILFILLLSKCSKGAGKLYYYLHRYKTLNCY